MKPEEIKLSDWARIFAGNVPPEFYLELLIRTAIIYVLLMGSMRMMGKRMNTQMSRLEVAALVSLAAAIGVPMLAPDRGLIPAVIVAMVVVLVTRVLSALSAKSQLAESITQDHLDTLVKDGVLQTKTMKLVRISREQILSQLRDECLLHTGQVRRLYMEANGSFSLVRSDKGKAGLPVLPEWDKEFIAEKLEPAGITICNRCGTAAPAASVPDECPNCSHNGWTMAVQERSSR